MRVDTVIRRFLEINLCQRPNARKPEKESL